MDTNEPKDDATVNSFRRDVESVINQYSQEQGSNTPDFILAEYITECLAAFDKAVRWRDQWYGKIQAPGGM